MANWPATLAAVQARGPRCDKCGSWTFRPLYLNPFFKGVRRLCPDCLKLTGISKLLMGAGR